MHHPLPELVLALLILQLAVHSLPIEVEQSGREMYGFVFSGQFSIDVAFEFSH